MVAVSLPRLRSPGAGYRRCNAELIPRAPVAHALPSLDAFQPLLDVARRDGRLFDRDIERFLEALPVRPSAGLRAALLQELLDARVDVLPNEGANPLRNAWESFLYWKKVIAYGSLLTALVWHEWWLHHIRAPLPGQ